VVEEAEAFLDLGDDVLRDQFAACIQIQVTKVGEELRRRGAEKIGER
jgi:hypothetical protein